MILNFFQGASVTANYTLKNVKFGGRWKGAWESGVGGVATVVRRGGCRCVERKVEHTILKIPKTKIK